MKMHGNSILFTDAEREELKALIDKKYGKVSNSADYESTGGLHDMGIEGDVYVKTGEMISGSTLERLAGLTSDKRRAGRTTLSKLAEYLDFSSADTLVRYISRKAVTSKGFGSGDFDFGSLFQKHNLLCMFGGKMEIELKYLAENTVEVIHVQGSVLQEGDKLLLTQLAIDKPLGARQLIRREGTGNHKLGPYTTGFNHPVLHISLKKRDKG